MAQRNPVALPDTQHVQCTWTGRCLGFRRTVRQSFHSMLRIRVVSTSQLQSRTDRVQNPDVIHTWPGLYEPPLQVNPVLKLSCAFENGF